MNGVELAQARGLPLFCEARAIQLDLMDQPTRMWKTLGCLVAAMTGTSVFLGWMNPSRRLVGNEPSPNEIHRLARMVIGLDSGIAFHQGRWDDIEVVMAPGPITARSMLAAGKASATYHFQVDRRGRPIRSQRWREQAAVNGLPHTILIQVAPSHEARTLSPAQLLCVRALIATLHEALAPGGSSLPVRLPAEWNGSVDIERTAAELPSSV